MQEVATVEDHIYSNASFTMQELATVGDHIYSNASFTMVQGVGNKSNTSFTMATRVATVGDHIYSNASFTMVQGYKSWQQWETTSIVMPALPWYRDARVGNSGRPHL